MGTLLSAHCESRGITLAELSSLPAPEPLGPLHRPVPHHELVEVLKEELGTAGYEATREEYAVQHRRLERVNVLILC